MEDGLLDVEQPMKASWLRWQMQQRIDEIAERVESVGGKDES
jgi:DNA-binding ferritin-like protein